MKLLKEPLIHFLILGLAVISIDRYVIGRADDPRRIEFNNERFREIVDIFEEGQGRPPAEDEIEGLIVQWTQNEVLYREALSMELDKGDEMIRQRLILKIRNILFNNVIAELPGDEALEAWFEENRSAYDRPALLDFEQFLIEGADEAAALTLAATLADQTHPSEYVAAYRRYERRPIASLTSVFGDEQGQRLIDATNRHWTAVESRYGWHLARVSARHEGVPAKFEDVRYQVARDWEDWARKQELATALAAIVEDYDVRYTVTREAVEGKLRTAELDTQGGAP